MTLFWLLKQTLFQINVSHAGKRAHGLGYFDMKSRKEGTYFLIESHLYVECHYCYSCNQAFFSLVTDEGSVSCPHSSDTGVCD